MQKLTPEEAIQMWRELEGDGAVPYAASDDLILSMTGHGDLVTPPSISEFGFDHHRAATFGEYLVRGNVIKAYQQIAENVGRITNTTPINQDVWQEYGSTHRLHLFTLFDQRQYQYGRRSGNLLLAPVQATVGLITVAAVRGYMTVTGAVAVTDISFMVKGSDQFQRHTLLGADADHVARAMMNILIEQGVVKVPEIVAEPAVPEPAVPEPITEKLPTLVAPATAWPRDNQGED